MGCARSFTRIARSKLTKGDTNLQAGPIKHTSRRVSETWGGKKGNRGWMEHVIRHSLRLLREGGRGEGGKKGGREVTTQAFACLRKGRLVGRPTKRKKSKKHTDNTQFGHDVNHASSEPANKSISKQASRHLNKQTAA